MKANSKAYLAKFRVTKPEDVMTIEGFPWSDFLQAFLTNQGVIVSKLHPIVGLRLAHLFVQLMIDGHASPDGANSETQILSAVRLKGSYDDRVPGSQWWFWARDLQRLGKQPSKPPALQPRGTGGVANPEYERGQDSEGIMRRSSNHVAQQMPEPWGARVGYAIDLRTTRGTDDAAWAPVHRRLKASGFDWPLKRGVSRIVERWHIQAQGLNMAWYPGPWPKDQPGIHRPLMAAFKGDDVKDFQRQAVALLGESGVKIDGDYGPTAERLAKALQKALGRPQTGVWTKADQATLKKAQAKAQAPVTQKTPEVKTPAKPVVKPAPQSLESRVDRLEREVAQLKVSRPSGQSFGQFSFGLMDHYYLQRGSRAIRGPRSALRPHPVWGPSRCRVLIGPR